MNVERARFLSPVFYGPVLYRALRRREIRPGEIHVKDFRSGAGLGQEIGGIALRRGF
jgi:hypothetical protein